MKRVWAFCFFCILPCLALTFSGCQYQFGYGDIPSKYSTISIPFVEGDGDGVLTAELVKQFSATGALRYVPNGGSLTLKAKWINLSDENIGFRYDRKKSGELKKYIIPTEARSSASLEVTVMETCGERVVLGPTIITATVDYDHQFYSDRHASNVFSMGQLVDIDSARETVMVPLNRLLAEKVVDYVINSW